MTKSLYIQPYTNTISECKISTDVLERHYRVIRLINLFLTDQKLKKSYKVNCILVKDYTDAEFIFNGNICTIELFYDEQQINYEYILELYITLLNRLIHKVEDLKLDLNKVKSQVVDVNYIEGKKKGILKKSLDKKYFYQIDYEFPELYLLSLCVSIFNENKDFIKKINFATTRCGILVNDIIKTIIKEDKWIDNQTVKVIKPNLKDYWLIDILSMKIDFYSDKAEKGDPHAQYDLGLMYEEGNVVLKDLEKSMYWLTQSANQGFSRAQKKIENK